MKGRSLIFVALVGLLSSCAQLADQPASCAFGGVTADGAPIVSDWIEASTFVDNDGNIIKEGPEDFAVLKVKNDSKPKSQIADNRWHLFISAVERPAKTSHGRIVTVVFDADDGTFDKSTLTTMDLVGFDDELHPVGISLVEHGKSATPYLYVINKRDEAHGGAKDELNRIEKFSIDIASNKLIHERSFESPNLVDANDLLVTTDRHIYVSNPRIIHSFWTSGEDYWQWPSLVRHHSSLPTSEEDQGDVFERIDRQLDFANGIARPRDDRLVVADFFDGRLVIFDRDEQTGSLEHVFNVDLDGAGRPDNLMLSDDGEKLYIAVHKSLLHSIIHLMFGWSYAPSAVYELDLTEAALDKPPEERLVPKLVLDDGGKSLKAASTALAIGKYMLVSQLKAPEVYAFACRIVNHADA